MPTEVSRNKKKKIIIVGAGMSGLTAGAYILRGGHEILILEKTSECGGLVNSFRKDGFLFDTGPRAVGNAGILVPMLDDLGIDLPLVKGEVSTGILDRIVHYDSNAGVDDFIGSLQNLFPEALNEIKKIEKYIRTYTSTAATLNRVPNPFFKDMLKDREFLIKEFLPWLPSFLWAALRTGMFSRSIEDVLGTISRNKSLNDMVSQHFFKGTPANFAFGYFENFRDYKYPAGGTAELPKALARKIIAGGGAVQYDTEITGINPVEKILTDQNGNSYSYDLLLWAGDLNSLYRLSNCVNCPAKVRNSVAGERQRYQSVASGESVLSVFLAVDEKPEFFKRISRGHFIYTPRLDGLGELHRKQLKQIKSEFQHISKQELFNWLKDFCRYNSYEISIPVLKDSSLAPENKTGLIISLLFDGELFEMAEKAGWYEEFKEKAVSNMIDSLDQSVYPGLKKKIIFQKSATPLTLMKMFKTGHGAITGWSLEEKAPVPDSLMKITGTAGTSIPNVYKAGQWCYSPSGVPIAILTGRIAAGEILKEARRL